MNIFFLIGFMGSGKTHWGKKWAALGEYVFIDMDEVIEKKEGMPISTIFEQKGESYFRNLEQKCCIHLRKQKML
jgi:shikimate kinase